MWVKSSTHTNLSHPWDRASPLKRQSRSPFHNIQPHYHRLLCKCTITITFSQHPSSLSSPCCCVVGLGCENKCTITRTIVLPTLTNYRTRPLFAQTLFPSPFFTWVRSTFAGEGFILFCLLQLLEVSASNDFGHCSLSMTIFV